MGEISVKTGNNARNGGKNSLNRLIRCVCGKKIGPDPRNFNQRVSLGRNDLLIRTFLKAEAKPSLNEVKEIIEKYSSEDREKRLWDNVGFATDKGITWVDKYRMRDILNVPSEDYSTYSAAYIYEQISHKRKEFISPILKESKALQSQSRINKASGED
ncbi:hypothetical protein [Klebsiella pneumoniae]|uniref:hypothetical protein n=1 Tax=Klebsiella pneumoniae TaxID=573 RepID=UPI0009082D39|nr:hypothetical protein [Klebsiella pneumoniae]